MHSGAVPNFGGVDVRQQVDYNRRVFKINAKIRWCSSVIVIVTVSNIFLKWPKLEKLQDLCINGVTRKHAKNEQLKKYVTRPLCCVTLFPVS